MQQRITSDFDLSRFRTARLNQVANSSQDLKLCRVSFFPLMNRLHAKRVDLSMQTDIGLIARSAASIGYLCQLGENLLEWALDGVGDGLGDAG